MCSDSLRTFCRNGLLGFALALAGDRLLGAELFPYSLPSQQLRAQTAATPTSAPAPVSQISDAYYEQFAAKAKTLKPAERASLMSTFEQQRQEALKAGRVDEELHYRRLTYILDATK